MTTDLRPAAVQLTLEAQKLVQLLNRAGGPDEPRVLELADTIAERATAIAGELHGSPAVGSDRP